MEKISLETIFALNNIADIINSPRPYDWWILTTNIASVFIVGLFSFLVWRTNKQQGERTIKAQIDANRIVLHDKYYKLYSAIRDEVYHADDIMLKAFICCNKNDVTQNIGVKLRCNLEKNEKNKLAQYSQQLLPDSTHKDFIFYDVTCREYMKVAQAFYSWFCMQSDEKRNEISISAKSVETSDNNSTYIRFFFDLYIMADVEQQSLNYAEIKIRLDAFETLRDKILPQLYKYSDLSSITK